jgi:general secretion pathway protein I
MDRLLKKMAIARSKKGLFTSGIDGCSTTGFTLIEVVVALAILGIGLTVILELFSAGLRLGRFSEDYSLAVNYGRMKMEEIASQSNIEEGSEEGQFDDTFHWKATIQKVDLLSVDKDIEFTPPIGFYQITVNIIWKSGSKERSAIFESYRTGILEEGKS